MSTRMKTTRVFVSQENPSLPAMMEMAAGRDKEWYTDESMVRSLWRTAPVSGDRRESRTADMQRLTPEDGTTGDRTPSTRVAGLT